MRVLLIAVLSALLQEGFERSPLTHVNLPGFERCDCFHQADAGIAHNSVKAITKLVVPGFRLQPSA